MKKIKWGYISALAGVLLISGCGGNTDSTSSDTTSATTAETVQTEETYESTEKTRGTIIITEPTEVTAETTAATEENSESSADIIEVTDRYAELITAFDNNYLGLPQADKTYIFESSGKTADIAGGIYHAVSCFDEFEGELYYMCDFYISEDGAAVYRLYDATGEYVLLPETEHFPAFNPNTQTPEEVFGYVNELYILLKHGFIGYDPETAVAVGDREYFLIDDERFETMPSLLENSEKYLSSEIVNSLMELGHFTIGSDGRLYVFRDSVVGNPAYNGSTYELAALTETYAEYKEYASFTDDDGNSYVTEYTYVAENEYGVWRFTDFSPEYY